MNAVDIAVLVIAALCVLWGLYRGLVHTLLNLVGGILSFAGAFLIYPRVADALSSDSGFVKMISSLTDSGSLLGNLDLSSLSVAGLNADTVTKVVEKANLPAPIDSLLRTNLVNQVFQPLGNLATTAGDYVNQTVLSVTINVICFLLCFLICYVLVSIFTNFIRSVFQFPVLHAADSLAGGVAGLGIAALLCFVLFTMVPVLESVLPIEGVRDMVEQSQAAKLFSSNGLIISIMNHTIL